MVAEIRIYFEGHKSLRPGFKKLFSEIDHAARRRRIAFSVIPGNGAAQAKADFRLALEKHPEAFNILLLDSDGPDVASQKSVFWVVQIMESWFLGDKNALTRFYGSGFRESALRQNPRVEEIAKADVLSGLKQATRNTSKGEYHKTAHAPYILEILDATTVRRAAPNCDHLFQTILKAID